MSQLISSVDLITSSRHPCKFFRSKTEENWGRGEQGEHIQTRKIFIAILKHLLLDVKRHRGFNVHAMHIAGRFQLPGLICGNAPEQIVPFIVP